MEAGGGIGALIWIIDADLDEACFLALKPQIFDDLDKEMCSDGIDPRSESEILART